jgi:hypothetical protein
MAHSFEVRGRYRNRKGEYEVVSIDGVNMVLKHSDGATMESSIEMADRIWRNIQREERLDRAPQQKRCTSRNLHCRQGPAVIAANADLAVFTRNHVRYLREAAEICSQDNTRRILFRARSSWVSADRYTAEESPTEIYMSPVGGNGNVE